MYYAVPLASTKIEHGKLSLFVPKLPAGTCFCQPIANFKLTLSDEERVKGRTASLLVNMSPVLSGGLAWLQQSFGIWSAYHG